MAAPTSADDGERIFVPGQKPADPADNQPDAEYEDEELPEIYIAELRPGGRGLLGFDFGIGIMDPICGGCASVGGVAVDLFGGYQVVGRLALVTELAGLFHLLPDVRGESSGLLTHGSATAAARVWLIPRLWVQAGGGVGVLTILGDNRADKEWSPVIRMAIGGEPGHRRYGGIDISLRVTGGRFRLDETGRVPFYDAAVLVGYHFN